MARRIVQRIYRFLCCPARDDPEVFAYPVDVRTLPPDFFLRQEEGLNIEWK
jgi:hypothetical protein